MELTQEYFDKGLANIVDEIGSLKKIMATKDDIKAIRAEMATKEELKNQLADQSTELKEYVQESFAAQQVWMDERFRELIVKYDVRQRVEKLEKEFLEFKPGKPVHA